jgi:uncharacterized protein (DUF1697 family)
MKNLGGLEDLRVFWYLNKAMSRFIAFLRAINVGGHTVKMDQLRGLFEASRFSSVETFIASGNVVFDTKSGDATVLEKRIEKLLREALGYEVATFIRTGMELADIAKYKPFPQPAVDKASALNIAFLKNKLDEQSKQKLRGLRTDIDDFHVHEREVYWLCLKKQSESTFSNVLLEKTLGRQSTLRSVNTIKKLAEKYG